MGATPALRPNEGPHGVFRIGQNARIRIVQGDVTREKVDAVIVPTNTALALSGAAAAVMHAVNNPLQFRNGPLCEVFPALGVKDPLRLNPAECVIDLVQREAVGRIGESASSVDLQELGVRVPQQWKRVIMAFIREQGAADSDSTDSDDGLLGKAIQSSLSHALDTCGALGLKSVATVPFGAGLLGIPAIESARYMCDVLRLAPERQWPQEIVIAVEFEGQFTLFLREARAVLR
jgi:O-acetyl-ADP-ribose deacetylase (regulator of RNase III)